MLDAKRSNIHVNGQEVRDENVAGENTDVVFENKSPDREFRALRDGAGGEKGHDEEGRVKGCCALAT